MQVAVLLTCFNRRDKTLACLDSVYKQTAIEDTELEIFLVDDGSSDGTSDAVACEFPKVKIIRGNGHMFWNGGMNLAWKTAIDEGFDTYLWLNDDVSLYESAFKQMFDSFKAGREESGDSPVIVGSFCESETGEHAYGGFEVKKTLWSVTKRRMHPNGKLRACDTFNGNAVLIPQDVVRVVGILDPKYTHAFGDVDYGYRCMEKNIPVYLAPEYIGECARNSISQAWYSPDLTFIQRYKRLNQPTGCPPHEYFYSYSKKSNVFLGMIALSKLYLRLLLPGIWLKFSRSKSGE